MMKYANISYQYRPQTYWPQEGTVNAILGCLFDQRLTLHQEANFRALCLDETGDEKAKMESLVMTLALLGPPRPEPNQTEIARVEEHAGIISVRASRGEGKICYEIEDDHGSDFVKQRKESVQPLTLEELVQFIDGSRYASESRGLPMAGLEFLVSSDGLPHAEIRRSTRISSRFYLDLKEHYERVFDDWMVSGSAKQEAA